MKQIYLVEDDNDIRELIEYLLLSQDYKVQSFPNAEDFRKKMNTETPDLILLDIMLPDGNGLEMSRNLHSSNDTRGIPIVLMSAHTNIDLSQEEGVNDFISKPFDIEDFFERINRQLL
ncbi:hypothetical protein BH23BAC2_BH23BAC2_11400 [soil metagenome]